MAIEELNYMTRQTVYDVAEMKRRVLGHSKITGPTWKDAKPIEEARGDGALWFKIASSAQDSTNRRWTYTAKLAAKTATGFNGWSNSTVDTDNYTLYNTVEQANTTSGTYGNGVAHTSLVGTFNLKPLAAGAVVRAWPVTFSVSGTTYTEYWFSAVNQIDGACP
jgi:hypothetical protein